MGRKIVAKEFIKLLLYDVNEMLERGTSAKVIQKSMIRRLQRLDNPSAYVVWK